MNEIRDVVNAVAQNVVRLRRARGLSAADLAVQARLSKATLSKLESGEANPTVETLWGLANAMGVPLGELVSAPAQPDIVVVRAHEGPRVAGHGFEARLMLRRQTRGAVEAYAVDMHPGEPRLSSPHGPGMWEHVIIHHGEVEAGPTADPRHLRTGDSLTFPADITHAYTVIGDEEVRATVIMHYPDAGTSFRAIE